MHFEVTGAVENTEITEKNWWPGPELREDAGCHKRKPHPPAPGTGWHPKQYEESQELVIIEAFKSKIEAFKSKTV